MAAEGPGPTAPSRPALSPYPPSPAQRLAGYGGLVLAVVGLLGFIASTSFATGGPLHTGSFVGIEVNGVENAVHLGAGLLLLAAAAWRGRARIACWAVGSFFLLVFVWGLADRDQVFGAMPVNVGTLVFHSLAALCLLWACVASKDKRDTLGRDRVLIAESEGPQVVGPGSGSVGGPRAFQQGIDRRLPQKTHP